ncbi:hypothetical protein [Paenibacillus sp. PAMC 26794]|uniref:hypothetical protein n=1 Tax=Paenibacillus sp. PAMC 26794 TaxID=1257080 RepID=UPI000314678A|nr:hypothetical protein [Paenibacillus sp. PAMC 26794]
MERKEILIGNKKYELLSFENIQHIDFDGQEMDAVSVFFKVETQEECMDTANLYSSRKHYSVKLPDEDTFYGLSVSASSGSENDRVYSVHVVFGI